MHARSGGNLEVMGLMQGKVNGNTMVVMDAFALPVEGTETRVNAQAQANEYMVQYLDLIKRVRFAGRARGGKEHAVRAGQGWNGAGTGGAGRDGKEHGVRGGSGRDEGDGRGGKEHSVGAGQVGTGGTVSLPPVSRVGSRNAWFACWPTPASCMYTQVGRLENAIGWYHSHPGYGCWLSGIDVTTQMTNQQFQEPFLAVVVRTRRAHERFAVAVPALTRSLGRCTNRSIPCAPSLPAASRSERSARTPRYAVGDVPMSLVSPAGSTDRRASRPHCAGQGAARRRPARVPDHSHRQDWRLWHACQAVRVGRCGAQREGVQGDHEGAREGTRASGIHFRV